MWGTKELKYYPYNLDEKKELLIYKYACKKKLNRKQKRKLGEEKFTTYNECRAYVEEKYFHISLKSLYDVKRFLEHRKKGGKAINDAYKTLLVPWIIAMLTVMFGQSINLTLFQDQGLLMQFIGNILFLGIIFGSALMLFKKIVKEFIEQHFELLMYEDYQKIIGEMIVERMKHEK